MLHRNLLLLNGSALSSPAVVLWKEAVVTAGGVVSARLYDVVGNLIQALEQCGAWYLRDDYCFHACDNLVAARVTLKQRGTVTLSATAPTFVSRFGFLGNGTSAYINYGWNPYTGSQNYTQNSANFGVWVYLAESSVATSKSIFGNADNDDGILSEYKAQAATPSNNFFSINAASFLTSYRPTLIPTGWCVVERSSSTAATAYVNGVAVETSSSYNSVAIPNQSFYGLAGNDEGTSDNFSAAGISAAAYGGAMGAQIAAAEYAAMQAAITAAALIP